jgi:membrane protein DedA with SNARE-associated domain
VIRAALVLALLGSTPAGFLGIHVPTNLGYVAMGLLVGVESFGVPLPGETALIAASVLASRGKLDVVVVIVVAAGAAIIGDNLGYFFGRHGGRKLLEHPGPLHERRLALIAYGDRFFARHGAKTVFIGRWIGLLRFTAAWLAGANRMPAGQFFVFNALGGITWATTVALAAYWLGDTGAEVFKTLGVAGAVAFGVGLIGGLLWLRRRERGRLRG